MKEYISVNDGEMTNLHAELARVKQILRQPLRGCPRCEFDEAEGGIVNHCDSCCTKVTEAAYEVVNGEYGTAGAVLLAELEGLRAENERLKGKNNGT